jgi:3-hydroxyisobutyrate dehydrogenase-like beta-hydroxyacid dehydrogenase
MKRIAFIGLGTMGGGIAGTLLKAGYDISEIRPFWENDLRVLRQF